MQAAGPINGAQAERLHGEQFDGLSHPTYSQRRQGKRKAALQRIDKAIQALTVEADERAEGVHQARKRFKELRALLRLVREPLGARFSSTTGGCATWAARPSPAMPRRCWKAGTPWPANQPLFVSDAFRQIRLQLQQRAAPDGEVHADFDAELAEVLGELRALTQEMQH